jgi:hypothetical protein
MRRLSPHLLQKRTTLNSWRRPHHAHSHH